MHVLTVRIPDDLWEQVKAAAAREGVTPSQWVRAALEAFLEMPAQVGRLEDVEKRLARLEGMAGLE